MSSTAPSGTGEPAVAAGDDPRQYAAVLAAVYDAAMSGNRPPARPRDVISQSWGRVLDAGVDPDHGSPDHLIDAAELEARRAATPLALVLDDLTGGLDAMIADGDNILVIADASGRILWRGGQTRVLHRADRLGFIEGADWGERSVGTNAIGTALMSGGPVQVFSAEHFVRTHHTWTCAGAPIRDPRSGSLLGVVDVSGPAATIHPTTLALVGAVAKLAESQLREHHRRHLDELRAVAAPILARSSGPALAVDADGWVAAVDSVAPCSRLLLPRRPEPGRAWLHSLGACEFEPLPGGWLVRVADVQSPARTTLVELDFTEGHRPTVRISGATGSWTHRPSPRHAEILALLAAHPDGLSAAAMSEHLFGSDDRTVTVRAEMSRLRKSLGGVLSANPYRFAAGVDISTDLRGRTDEGVERRS
ncbi:helix-turn-helix domain-containing protein [Gordonia aichiensis]|nr:helix-turn-helix domain-containing protein [Gordonia aichiensis]